MKRYIVVALAIMFCQLPAVGQGVSAEDRLIAETNAWLKSHSLRGTKQNLRYDRDAHQLVLIVETTIEPKPLKITMSPNQSTG